MSCTQDSTSDSPCFTNLPEKVVEYLTQHLNVWNLMNLRLVCKTTKSWVEKPSIFKRLVVHVKNRNFLRSLLLSDVKWSNLTILCDSDDITGLWIRSEEYLNALEFLKPSLKILKLSEQRLALNNALDMIFSQCTNLEEIQIGTLDIAGSNLPLSTEVITSLSKLQTLVINYVAWDTEADLSFFLQAFEKCTLLKYLKLPYILSARLYSLYPSLNEDEIDQKLSKITVEFLMDPLTKVLRRKDCLLKFIDVENFEFDQILDTLAPACIASSTLLVNVLEAFEKDFTDSQKDLCGSIGSLLNCSKYLDLNKLTNLESISILEDYSETSDIDKNYENASMPSLKSVTLTLTKSILVSARLSSCFLHRKRETVENVDVRFLDLEGSAQASVFRTPRFASSLPNLKSLSLNGFDGKPEDYLMFWTNFPLLERLQLENCVTLNDVAMIGKDKSSPAFLNLKHLNRLTLEDGDVTDVVLETVLSRLSLEALVLDLPKVSFTGLSALKGSPLSSSLMLFYCVKPKGCPERKIEGLFAHFPNLKKSDVLF